VCPKRQSMCGASYFPEQDLHIGLTLSLDSPADHSSTPTWLMALQPRIRPGSEHRLSSTSPAKWQAHFLLSLSKFTVHRGSTRGVPMRKNCVSVTQLHCRCYADATGRASYLRQPSLRTRTHGTNESGEGQSMSLSLHACIYVYC